MPTLPRTQYFPPVGEHPRYPGALNTRRGRELVDWIALNDNDGNGDDLDEIACYISTTMLAHVYGVSRERVALAVADVRHAEGRVVADPDREHF